MYRSQTLISPVTSMNCLKHGISWMSSGPRNGRKCARFLVGKQSSRVGSELFNASDNG